MAQIVRARGLFGGSDSALLMKNSYSTRTMTAPEFEGAVIGAFGEVKNCLINLRWFFHAYPIAYSYLNKIYTSEDILF
ncbi:MAG: hypothetical protein ACTHYV_08755 [Psychroflexus sp.]|uniref:hypothetical protein n=1 Tax=Psychroflexus sp. S27 TaxID=1982757 RepID=UPI000C2ACC89|nr:hypothetical protein [Psychroflexus sp. S27]PJX20124.1 hypothetical protein CAP47_11365 [Psychroflexus sp. S27]